MLQFATPYIRIVELENGKMNYIKRTCLALCCLSALALTSTAFAFEPTDASESSLYNTRLIPAPRSTNFGRGVVVFNAKLHCAVLTSERWNASAEALEKLSKDVGRDFGCDVKLETQTPGAFLDAAQKDGGVPREAIDFVQKLADDDAFFQQGNAYRILALRDQNVSADATPEELAQRQNDAAGTLIIAASDLAGLRDSFKTLRQLSETFFDSSTTATARRFVPELEIDDAPALSFRGVHLCWFPETELRSIERSIRLAAYYKFNYVVLEFWGVFPFDANPSLNWAEFHTTKEDVRWLVNLGRELGVELIPQLNLFGHAPGARVASGKHTILDNHPEMEPLFEPDGWTWNIYNPATRDLLSACVMELYETFDHPSYFHIGGDEADSAGTSLIGRRKGNYGDALADWLIYFHDLLQEKNCRMMMWHDMLIPSSEFAGYTALGNAKTQGVVDKLPRDILICDWQYDAPKEKETWPTTSWFMDKGFDVIPCPWRNVKGIQSLGKTAVDRKCFGLLCTTWHVYYGAALREMAYAGAHAAWGTQYRGSGWYGAFNRHLRQALQNAEHKDYRTNGVNDWQVPRETNVP